MHQVLFSLIITAYNVEDYIEECIDSALNQTYQKVEVIIVDDGSMDATGEKCDAYLQRDGRVKVIHQENKGVIAARKAGIKNSAGRYIIFIDGDDWVDKELCEQFAQYIENYDADIILGGLVKEYHSYSCKVKNYLSQGEYCLQDIEKIIYPNLMYTGNFYEKGLESYICGRAVKREILEAVMSTINDRVSFAEGGVWLYSCMLKVNRAIITEDMFYHYRMRSDSMSIQEETSDKIVLVYENLIKNIVNEKRNVDNFILQLDYMLIYLFLWKNLNVFDFDKDKLYPFLQLKRGDRVVLYGAWRFGQIMKSYIEKRKFCDIVLWVDRNADEYREKGWDIELPEKILNVEYDYIILATGVYSVMQSMRNTLKQLGIIENILSIDSEVVNPSHLPEDIKKIKEKYIDSY